jgi:DNA-binding NarL/FixJ family response regulator
MEPDPDTVTVVAGHLDPLLSLGVLEVLCRARRVEILARDLDDRAIAHAIAQRAPRLVVLGESSEHDLLAWLKATEPAPAILVILRDPSPLTATTLLAAGVACLAQSATTADVLTAFDLAVQGERVFVSGRRRQVGRAHQTGAQSLTQRQAEVLRILSEGKAYAAVAHEMNINVATVRTHARALFRKLGVQNRQELVGRHGPYIDEQMPIDASSGYNAHTPKRPHFGPGQPLRRPR